MHQLLFFYFCSIIILLKANLAGCVGQDDPHAARPSDSGGYQPLSRFIHKYDITDRSTRRLITTARYQELSKIAEVKLDKFYQKYWVRLGNSGIKKLLEDGSFTTPDDLRRHPWHAEIFEKESYTPVLFLKVRSFSHDNPMGKDNPDVAIFMHKLQVSELTKATYTLELKYFIRGPLDTAGGGDSRPSVLWERLKISAGSLWLSDVKDVYKWPVLEDLERLGYDPTRIESEILSYNHLLSHNMHLLTSRTNMARILRGARWYMKQFDRHDGGLQFKQYSLMLAPVDGEEKSEPWFQAPLFDEHNLEKNLFKLKNYVSNDGQSYPFLDRVQYKAQTGQEGKLELVPIAIVRPISVVPSLRFKKIYNIKPRYRRHDKILFTYFESTSFWLDRDSKLPQSEEDAKPLFGLPRPAGHPLNPRTWASHQMVPSGTGSILKYPAVKQDDRKAMEPVLSETRAESSEARRSDRGRGRGELNDAQKAPHGPYLGKEVVSRFDNPESESRKQPWVDLGPPAPENQRVDASLPPPPQHRTRELEDGEHWEHDQYPRPEPLYDQPGFIPPTPGSDLAIFPHGSPPPSDVPSGSGRKHVLSSSEQLEPMPQSDAPQREHRSPTQEVLDRLAHNWAPSPKRPRLSSIRSPELPPPNVHDFSDVHNSRSIDQVSVGSDPIGEHRPVSPQQAQMTSTWSNLPPIGEFSNDHLDNSFLDHSPLHHDAFGISSAGGEGTLHRASILAPPGVESQQVSQPVHMPTDQTYERNLHPFNALAVSGTSPYDDNLHQSPASMYAQTPPKPFQQHEPTEFDLASSFRFSPSPWRDPSFHDQARATNVAQQHQTIPFSGSGASPRFQRQSSQPDRQPDILEALEAHLGPSRDQRLGHHATRQSSLQNDRQANLLDQLQAHLEPWHHDSWQQSRSRHSSPQDAHEQNLFEDLVAHLGPEHGDIWRLRRPTP
ncbi:hypothetical protein NDA10_000115 [Ustilago hordei]|uniref:Uncharacterized protein n=1 Tax=Ustilago hordei TaxID=120017 RepID=I2FXW4_USTHO|nr:uncharacterized protein UHO2_00235 [Ustilago hordei]KAJ1041237.1 hypothetical protein NDA10_000115 [Ustilago hordei]CCF51757.1 uncharacterized protein UHOR_03765 [Ustilago hordei]SYW81731.1 uncharacterized protein UHO2_00235 [Ustilago hordei]